MRAKPKILIVEDNPSNHELYRDAFEKAGFDVVLSADADGYLPEAVSNISPDIISMDIMIGKDGAAAERDGLDAIEKLKSDLRTHEIPVIVLTNFFEEGKIQRAKQLGAVDYIISSSHSFNKIPEHFLRYLNDPAHYEPSHPSFRKDL